jgi:metal-responsive CopG/Arc/MetJ family transcriptional regulator
MKTAISLPDELFESVEQIVRRTRRPRSEVYADALREFVARHAPEDEMTESWNAVLDEVGRTEEDISLTRAAARQILKNSKW